MGGIFPPPNIFRKRNDGSDSKLSYGKGLEDDINDNIIGYDKEGLTEDIDCSDNLEDEEVYHIEYLDHVDDFCKGWKLLDGWDIFSYFADGPFLSYGPSETGTNGNGTSSTQREFNLQRLRDRAEKLKSDIIDQIDTQINDTMEEFVQDVETFEVNPLTRATSFKGHKRTTSYHRELFRDVTKHEGVSQRKKKGDLPDKEFIARRSVLTELLEISHIRTIYHIFVAILIIFTLNTIVYDTIETGRLKLDFSMMKYTFGKLPIVMWLWVIMAITTCGMYPAFYFWAYNRKPGNVRNTDYAWLGLYIAYQIFFLVYPSRVIVNNELPPASSVIVVCEQVRLLMKCHAFVRHNIPRALAFDPKKTDKDKGDENSPCPDFSKYLYFLFAPTLVYRDSYPRTPTIRWNYVVSNFAQVLACLFYTYYIFERFCVPVFRDFSKESITPKRLILSAFGCMMPGTLVLFIAFFAILHSWLNAFAEMLRFGDRLFYKDWWNSSSFSNYYRTWNVVVHDWLYTYVYKDVYRAFGRKVSRPAAMSAVFLLSAVFHEYILTVSFRFFYPILFVMFAGAGFGFIFISNKDAPRSGNVFMWVGLFIGNGLLMCLYSMEWYARQNCSVVSESFVDYLIPRSWVCDRSELTS